MFEHCMHATTPKDFDDAWKRLIAKSNSVNRKISKYFTKNWRGCSDMWTTVGRKIYFTAGNTTTNIIEALWHQLKILLNVTSALDKCLQGKL